MVLDLVGQKQMVNYYYLLTKVIVSIIITNVLKTGPVIEPEKLPVHGSLVGPVVEPVT